jgi:hypothetical protein
VTRNTSLDLVKAKLPQAAGDYFSRALLLIGKFRVAVEVATRLNEALLHVCDSACYTGIELLRRSLAGQQCKREVDFHGLAVPFHGFAFSR